MKRLALISALVLGCSLGSSKPAQAVPTGPPRGGQAYCLAGWPVLKTEGGIPVAGWETPCNDGLGNWTYYITWLD
jgi:hypothetical protein